LGFARRIHPSLSRLGSYFVLRGLAASFAAARAMQDRSRETAFFIFMCSVHSTNLLWASRNRCFKAPLLPGASHASQDRRGGSRLRETGWLRSLFPPVFANLCDVSLTQPLWGYCPVVWYFSYDTSGFLVFPQCISLKKSGFTVDVF